MIDSSVITQFDYRRVFGAIEATLLAVVDRNPDGDEIRHRIENYKHFEGQKCTDEDVFRILVLVIFYSGFRAQTVTDRRDVIRSHFSDLRTAAHFGDADVERILADPKMIRNERKVRACVENAGRLMDIARRYGSIGAYIDSFDPQHSLEGLLLLKEELEARFAYLGGVTVYHLMTDLGLPVLKPDRVVCRMFQRLGLIENPDQLLKTILQGRRFAQATGLAIRYIDIVFAAYGQVSSRDLGIDRGICVDSPRCELCGARNVCPEFQKRSAAVRSR